ncbi:MAG TPA: TonB-dependent receptor plug domain-containing protein, partial [Flavobacteriaceae bacterium]|nr:TonB-dependent receptor plug domain-containing protein [Flavobacteriaceae bacterium]
MKTKFNGFLTLFLALAVQVVFAQEKTVTGIVTDASGPLPGVTVFVKGTSTGTQTDFDGNYSLKANVGAVLQFSFMGMETVERTVGEANVINVQMNESAEALEEVVVTALGVSKEKIALGYATQEVSGEDLNTVQQSDAVSALSGRVAGVQVSSSTNMGGSSRILIRGANSISQENQPLFVVDGIPINNSNFNGAGTASGGGGVDYGNMLNDINPDEIENINVLKGTAAAIYGSRAANGVVIITTKRAKKGQESVSVDFNSTVSFDEVDILPNMQRKYGGGAVIPDSQGGVNGFEQVTYNGNTYLVPQYAVDESWGPRYDPSIEVVHWDGIKEDGSIETRPWVAPANDVEDFWETGLTTTNSIGINKSGKGYGARAAYKNTLIDGTLPGSEQKKHDVKLSINTNITEKLIANASLNFVNSKSKGRAELGYSDRSVGQKFFQWGQRQLDYERLKNYKNSTGQQLTWNRKSFFDPTPKYSDNPYWTVYENYPDDARNRLLGTLSLSYEIIDNLFLKGSVYGDYYNFSIRERMAVGSQAEPSYYEINRE